MTQTAAEVRHTVARSGFANPLTLAILVEDDDYLKVYADEELLQAGVDYTVLGIGDANGVSIEIIGAEDANEYVGYESFTALYDPVLQQGSDLSLGGNFGRAFEVAADRQSRQLQAIADRTLRSLKMPVYVEGDIELVDPVDGHVPVWNGDENRFDFTESPASSAASAAAAAASAATAAAEAAAAAVASGSAEDAATAAGLAQVAAEAAQAAAEAAAASASDKLPLAGGTMTGPIAFTHQTSPANPASGLLSLFAKNDDKFYTRNSAGDEVELGAGGLLPVADRTALKALDTTEVTVAYLTESGREGVFLWMTGNYSTQVAADTREGVYVKATAVASSAGAWVRVYAGALDVSWFGAVGDGVTDDAAAIQSAVDLAGLIGANVTLRDGNYVVGTTITVAYDTMGFWGAGPYQTVITGNFLSGDVLYVGVSSGQRVTMDVGGFRIASSVVKTSGAGLHAERIGRCFFHDIIADGQDGTGNLYHGFWFDKVDKVSLRNFEARGQQDGVRLNGTVGAGPKADFNMANGKIASCTVGFRIGGAFGGTYLEDLSIISNTTNVLIDTTIAAEVNREVMFSPTVAIDGGTTGVKISDALGAGQSYFQFDGTWIASASGNNVEVDSGVGHTILCTGVRNYNAGSDGYEVASTTAYVLITGGQIAYNTAYGVNFTGANANSRVEMPLMHNNGSGNFNGTVSYMIRDSSGRVGNNIPPEATFGFVTNAAMKAYGTVWTANDQNAYALKAGRYSVAYGGSTIDTTIESAFLELQAQTIAFLRMTVAGRRTVVSGNFGRGVPVTKTGNFTLADTENHVINGKSGSTCVMTSTPGSYSGRELYVVNEEAQALTSAASNVVPRVGGAAGTAILPATDGAWALLVSNGTNWKIMASGT